MAKQKLTVEKFMNLIAGQVASNSTTESNTDANKAVLEELQHISSLVEKGLANKPESLTGSVLPGMFNKLVSSIKDISKTGDKKGSSQSESFFKNVEKLPKVLEESFAKKVKDFTFNLIPKAITSKVDSLVAKSTKTDKEEIKPKSLLEATKEVQKVKIENSKEFAKDLSPVFKEGFKDLNKNIIDVAKVIKTLPDLLKDIKRELRDGQGGEGKGLLGSLAEKFIRRKGKQVLVKEGEKVAEKAVVKGGEKILEKEGEKILAKEGEKAIEKTAVKGGEKLLAKEATKIGGKTIGKSLLKKIPLIGLLAGGAFAAQRAFEGDWKGAGMELASGGASMLPGIGTGTSLAIDAAIAGRDIYKATKEEQPEVKSPEVKAPEITPEPIKQQVEKAPQATPLPRRRKLAEIDTDKDSSSAEREYSQALKAGLIKNGQVVQSHAGHLVDDNGKVLLPDTDGSRQKAVDAAKQLAASMNSVGGSKGGAGRSEIKAPEIAPATSKVPSITPEPVKQKVESVKEAPKPDVPLYSAPPSPAINNWLKSKPEHLEAWQKMSAEEKQQLTKIASDITNPYTRARVLDKHAGTMFAKHSTAPTLAAAIEPQKRERPSFIAPSSEATPAIKPAEEAKSSLVNDKSLEEIAANTGDTNKTLAGLVMGFNNMAKALREFGVKVSNQPPVVLAGGDKQGQQPMKHRSSQYAAAGNSEISNFRMGTVEASRFQPA